jgi:polysaccharide export outer membrane protein
MTRGMLFIAVLWFCIPSPGAKAQNSQTASPKPPASAQAPPPAQAPSTSPSSSVGLPAQEQNSSKPANSMGKAGKGIRADDPSLAGYTIGEQDVLDIDVWREKELSGQVVVRPDGKITVPLVNEIYVIGMTPLQLQTMLMDKLQPFVTAPQVTVAVHEINSRKVYLMGEVAHEGVFHINSTTTVSQIIAEAGGLHPYAKRNKIYVLRNVDGKQVRFPFNYDAVIKGKANSQDLVLKPGDKIVVP